MEGSLNLKMLFSRRNLLTDAEIQTYVATPAPPTLSDPKKLRVRSVLDSLNAKGKKGAFGSKVQSKMVEGLVSTSGAGAQLTNEEATAVAYQIKAWLEANANDGQPLTIGVKAALAGSVLGNLPSTLPQNAKDIPDILAGIDGLTFQ